MEFCCIYKLAARMPMLRSAVHIEWPVTQLFSAKTLQKGVWLFMQKDDYSPS